MKNKNRFQIILGLIIFWIATPIRLVKKAIYEYRFFKKVDEANDIFQKSGVKCFVVQYGMRFFVGTREQLRRNNMKMTDLVKKEDSRCNWNYRNAIVYTVEYGKKTDYIHQNDSKSPKKQNKMSKS